MSSDDKAHELLTRERDELKIERDAHREMAWQLKIQSANHLQRAQAAEQLLKRIAGWDMMDAAADGTYWRREIAAVLSKAGK